MERLSSASLSEVLDKVAPAIAAGAVTILSVEAIRDRSGDRWARKREQVESFVDRAFERLSDGAGFISALNDAEFAAVQPKAGRAAAVGLCAKLLRETLDFFLGAAAREDMRLFEVTAFTNGELSLRAVEGGALDGEENGSPRSRTPNPAPPCEVLPGGPRRRISLVTSAGLSLDIDIMPEPTWNVAARAIASHLLRVEVSLGMPEEAPRPTPAALLSPDIAADAALAGLDHAATLIGSGAVQVALHAPILLSALTYSTSRYRLLHALRGYPSQVRRYLVLEIVGLTDGLPQCRLAELVGILNPYAAAVLARAPSELSDVSSWRRCGLKGVTLDGSHLSPSDRSVQYRLGRFAKASTEVARACVAYGLRSRSLMFAAWAGGFTHLSGPALLGEISEPTTVLRVGPAELFASNLRGVA